MSEPPAYRNGSGGKSFRGGSTIARRVRSSRRSRARRARISPPRYDGPDAVPGEAEPVMDSAAASEDRKVRRGDVDRAAPRVGHCAAARLREEAAQRALCLRDDVRVELEPVGRPAAHPHRAAAPAEHDPAVTCRARVVDERSAVDDRLAARPAKLVEDVRNGLGEDDVARCDREREPIAGERGGRGVDGEDGRARHGRARCGSSTPPSRIEPRDRRALVNPHASLEELRAEPEREPGGMHGRVQAIERAAEEERGCAAGADLVSR